jgi:hypothetical protein
VRYHDAVPRTRWRAAVALALACWLLVSGAESALPGAADPPHGPHALAAALHGEFAAVTDHPHFQDGSTPAAPDTVAEAVLPRAAVTLIALTLIATLVAAAPLWRQAALAAIRGPPRRVTAPQSGRALLTRLCIARR